MLKVMTIIGTRPEIIKMSRVIFEFDQNFNHILVHTGQNFDYELNKIFFEDLGVREPDHYLNVATKSTASTIGKIIENSDKVMDIEKPDALVLYGDTNSCLSVISAKRRKIPIFHLEAGNRCFDQRVPEEINRKVVDHLSDINLVLSEHARRYLLAEGIKPDLIIKVGSNMREVLNFHSSSIDKSKILKRLKLRKKEYFIVSIHREENVDSEQNLLMLIDTINAIARKYNLPVIISTHPRTKKRIKQIKNLKTHKNVRYLKPFGFHDYISLQINSKCVISDSGTITEECSMLNFPAITIRNSHERPEGMDVGTLLMSGLKKQRVLESINIAMKYHDSEKRIFPNIADYENVNASKHISKIVLSYVDFINRTIWHRDNF